MSFKKFPFPKLLLGLVVLTAVNLLGLLLIKSFRGELIINPTAFSLGLLEVRWYGLIVTLAVVTAWHWTMERIKKYQISIEKTELVLMLVIIGGIIGARLGYILQNIDLFSESPIRILALSEGGLSIHGALLAGIATIYLAGRLFKVSWQKILDAIALPVLLAMIIGRLGNYLNYEAFGWPTTLPWKMFVPAPYRLEPFLVQSFFHPVFAYEMILNLLGLLWLLQTQKSSKFLGENFLKMLAIVSLNRFVVEFFRINDSYLGYFSLAQVVSLLILVLCLVLISLATRQSLIKNHHLP